MLSPSQKCSAASPFYEEIPFSTQNMGNVGNKVYPMYEEIQVKSDKISDFTQCEAYGASNVQQRNIMVKNGPVLRHFDIDKIHHFNECPAYEKPQVQ